jgi:hypothetical protein
LTPGQLVNAVAIALNVPAETVVQHDRNLVVAGLRTKGGRGHSAPKVAPLDAARLLVAVLGSARVLDSVETVQAFTEASFHPRASTALGLDPAIARLPQNHNFIEALAALIIDASAPFHAEQTHQFLQRFAGMFIVCETRPIGGAIRSPGSSAEYKIEEQAILERNEYDPGIFDYDVSYRQYGIFQVRSTRGVAIVLLGRAFRENGLPFKTTQEAIAGLSQSGAGKPKKRNAKRAAG